MINTIKNLEKQRRKATKRLARLQKHIKAYHDAEKMKQKYEQQIVSYGAMLKKAGN